MNKFIKILIFLAFSHSFVGSTIYSMDPNFHNPKLDNINDITSINVTNLTESEIIGIFYKYRDYWKNQKFNGKNLIHIAAQNGWGMLFNILICEDTDVNILDNNRHTPLYLALVNKHFDIVKVILSLNFVDTTIRYDNNQTILDIALQNPESQESLEVIKLIKEKSPNFVFDNAESLNTTSSTVNYPNLKSDFKVKKNKSNFNFKKFLAIASISSLSAYLLYRFVNNNKKDTNKSTK